MGDDIFRKSPVAPYISERKGTVLEHSRLPLAKTVSVMEHLRGGCGMRGTSRLVKVNPNTVMRYARLAGGHARKLHDELVAASPLTRELQLDEKWSFVYKKEARCEECEKTFTPVGPMVDYHGRRIPCIAKAGEFMNLIKGRNPLYHRAWPERPRLACAASAHWRLPRHPPLP